MGQINQKSRVLGIFYEYPEKSFTVRQISKLSRVPKTTAQRILLELRKNGLITKENRAKNSLIFKTTKVNYFVEKVVSSGLINELVGKLNPSCIILFGSIRKGDSMKESDIDIFVESPIKKELDLTDYEKMIGHSIQLFVEENINKLPVHLFNNIINGIKLFGELSIK